MSRAISKSKRFRIFERDNYTCQYCGAKPTESELRVDHVHPVSQGGSNDPKNLITACFDCNAGKGAMVLRRGSPRATVTKAEQVEAEQYDLDTLVRESTRVYKTVGNRAMRGEWLPENDFLKMDRRKSEQAARFPSRWNDSDY